MAQINRVSSLLALALAGAACSEENPALHCVSQPIYFGSEVPGSVSLSIAQRLSIVRVDSDEQHSCSGIALTPSWVVTAQHCDLGINPSVTIVPQTSDPLTVPVTETQAHPSRDILLLRAELSRSLWPLEMVPVWAGDVGPDWVGTKADLAGFGRTEQAVSGELQFATEIIASVDSEAVRVDGAGKSGACFGDSGGPLFVSTNPSGAPALLGVMSEGSASCVGLDAYVRLDQATDWLRSHVGSLNTTTKREVGTCR